MKYNPPISLRLRYLVYGILYQSRKNIAVSHDKAFFALYKEVTDSGRLTMNLPELYNIYRIVQRCKNVPGDIAELGVYRGASARIITEVKAQKTLHLFDTFSGLPEISRNNDLTDTVTAFTQGGQKALAMESGKFSAEYEDVRMYLSPFTNIQFHVGLFPHTALGLENHSFSIIHLDADIYSSTLEGLKFFYPRLSCGGVLISHDYGTVSCPGVKKAFDEFMADKPEMLIELWDTQVMLIKSV